MGKGDKRTRRGKINRGTHGKTRPKKKHVTTPKSAKTQQQESEPS